MLEQADRLTGRRILILYARFGEGHWQAAQALKAAFARQGSPDVILFDLLAEAHPMLNEVSRYVYKKSYTYWPQIYGWVYAATKEMKPRSLFAHWLHSIGADTLKRLIRQIQPDAVVHTFPSLVLPAISGRNRMQIPMYNVVTDFELHMRWVHPRVNKYFVATEDLCEQLAASGVPRERIAATGIPLRPAFGSRRPQAAALTPQRYGLDPLRPIVLIMGGAQGMLHGIQELCGILSAQPDIQIAMICGHNRVSARSLRSLFAGKGNVAVFGYVEQIDEIMGMASCIVTKPGGLTLSEAIMAELPIFLYRPVPGQERGNARYLAAKGAAVICRSSRELANTVLGVLRSPTRLREMKQAVADLRQEGSADRIVLDILQDLPIMENNEFALR